MRSAKTDDPLAAVRREFAAGMVRLGVWYTSHLLRDGRITTAQIADALTRRVNIYRLTTLWNGRNDPALGHDDPRWSDISSRLAELVESAPADLEELAVALLDPWLVGHPEPPPEEVFGCWYYRVVGEGIADSPGVLGRIANPRKLWLKARRLLGVPAPDRHAELHFFNACAPRSPFADPLELARSLSELVADCRRRHPEVRFLWCATWLNNRREFLSLFPESWRSSATEKSTEDVDTSSFGRARLNTDNWWGQFMRRDGSLNEAIATRFRESGGTFPFPNLVCHTEIVDVARHLAALIEGKG